MSLTPVEKSETNQIDFKKIHHQAVSVKGGKIEYYRFGKGSPVILISGYVVDISSWDRVFLNRLAQKHEVIIFNNRGMGRSFNSGSLYNSFALAEDTFQLSQKLGLKKPAVLGLSMGGMIAQRVAANHSDKFSHLILINTIIAGDQGIYPNSKVQDELIHIPKNVVGHYIHAINLFFPPNWKARMAYSLAVERFQPVDYIHTDISKIMIKQQYLIRNWFKDNTAAKKLSKITFPVLILNGKKDIVIPPVNSEILAKNISHSSLKSWSEGGHGMIFQFPTEIAQTINEFLE